MMIDKNATHREGYFIEHGVLDKLLLERLIRLTEERAVLESGRGGVRNLLDLTEFRELANSEAVQKLVAPVLGDGAFVVRGILFDKTDSANWKVPWHQDVTIAVTERVEAEGFGPWSVKAGVLHVQPPVSVLEKMVSVRLHLDDCPAENGALKVLPGTHAEGKLSQSQIESKLSAVEPFICSVGAGDALVMRPLLLHASSASAVARHRRVLHFDYSVASLPEGMVWAERRLHNQLN